MEKVIILWYREDMHIKVQISFQSQHNSYRGIPEEKTSISLCNHQMSFSREDHIILKSRRVNISLKNQKIVSIFKYFRE